jgi:hypothetical protein
MKMFNELEKLRIETAKKMEDFSVDFAVILAVNAAITQSYVLGLEDGVEIGINRNS